MHVCVCVCEGCGCTPAALRGPCNWGDEAGVPAANGATSLVVFCWLTP